MLPPMWSAAIPRVVFIKSVNSVGFFDGIKDDLDSVRNPDEKKLEAEAKYFEDSSTIKEAVSKKITSLLERASFKLGKEDGRDDAFKAANTAAENKSNDDF